MLAPLAVKYGVSRPDTWPNGLGQVKADVVNRDHGLLAFLVGSGGPKDEPILGSGPDSSSKHGRLLVSALPEMMVVRVVLDGVQNIVYSVVGFRIVWVVFEFAQLDVDAGVKKH